ncbi:sulfatase-like hydrolase/transferase [Luteolibacter flavescens]|uniref:Sulfatase-like hydrolase/transferase n=1 Tax=Luteolibacter flavescens TaxID=1859460 RepID=A0ABT3FK90_9BACT|nr:sulfatase/phosphatase domain-containing protein [Luteolibacter flavescens]MCW1883701.1 sulfatase-like hydrolase/transferase [Luteolibacter flavescens]
MRPLILLAALAAPVLFAAERPNILFIFSDDHALNAISAYGGPLKDLAPTPNLDRIARDGAIFTRSYCGNSICGPSRATVLTGKHSHINGFPDNDGSRFDGSQTTFPKLLQKAGYQTSLIGKWHLVSQPTGFDHWEILPGQGSYYNPEFVSATGRKREQGYCTDVITDKAIAWLEGRDKTKPFVLMCQHKAPHRNWSPALRHLDLFKDVTFPEPPTLFDNYEGRSGTLKEQQMSIARDISWGHDMKFKGQNLFPEDFTSQGANGEYQRMTAEQKQAWDEKREPENEAFIADMKAGKLKADDVTRWKHQRYLKDYLRTVRAVDEGVGRVLDYLDKSGLAENTLVIYSSDQGFYLGEHGWYDKRWMFEESLSMPFIARWPGVVKPGLRSEALIQNIDYAPTFLEAAGVAIPASIQGKSLLPVLKGETPADWRKSIYYFYSGERTHRVAAHDGVRSERHKLMHFPATKEWNLFDLEKDPQELKSVHDDPAYAPVLAEMKKTYEEQRKNYHVSQATIPANRFGEAWWKTRHEEKVKLAKKGGYDLVFIGDSITQGWEGGGKATWDKYYAHRNALNLGFSGDRTEQVLWRLMNGELENVDPKLFVLMIGTNNTGHRQDDPEMTADGIKLILELLQDRKPDAKVLLLSIFPRGAKPEEPLRQLNDQINARIKSFADGERVQWLEVSDAFLDDEKVLAKEIMPDFLHPNDVGYAIWAKVIEKHIAKLTGTPEVE